MKISLSKRIVSFVLCLTVLLAGFAYKPQKTEAVAVSASVVAAVAAIMTACGVRYWASTNEYAMDYLSDQINSYLVLNTPSGTDVPTYEEWLGIDAVSQIFEVTANGAMSFAASVASPILDFVRWSFERDNVYSNGPTVGLLAGPVPFTAVNLLSENSGEASFQLTSDSSFRASFSDIKCYNRSAFFAVTLYTPGVYAARVTINNVNEGNTENIGTYGYVSLALSDTSAEHTGGTPIKLVEGNTFRAYSGESNPCQYVCLSFNNPTKYTNSEDIRHSWGVSCTIEIEGGPNGLAYPDRVKVEPSPDVYVPDDVLPDQAAPYVVATNAALAQGMTADRAADAIMDAVITTGLEAEAGDDAGDDTEPEGGVVAGWGWLSDTLDAIHDFIAGIAQTVLGLPQAIGQAASDVITGVGNAISTALYDAFVPSEASIDAFVATLAANFDNHFSILSYPFSLLGRFVLEVVDAPGAHELVWPDIYEPFSGQRLIAAGSYNLDTALENENFRTAYDIYMTVIKGYIAFQFIAYLYAWFCDVFRMRNDDYANPIFDQEPIDDGPDDWDGYDSYFET